MNTDESVLFTAKESFLPEDAPVHKGGNNMHHQLLPLPEPRFMRRERYLPAGSVTDS